jgi:hypothetical protein
MNLGEQIIAKYEKSKNTRTNWDHHWQEVADLVLPTREFTYDLTPGEKRRNKIFNDTAPNAASSLASALAGMLTNTSIRWFALGLNDPKLAGREDVKRYLYESTSIMLEYFDSSRSQFALASHEMYLDLVAFGTAVMYLNTEGDDLVFQAKKLSNFYVMENEAGVVTESYRHFTMTIRDAMDVFGEELSPSSLRMADPNHRNYDPEGEVNFVHAIYKRQDRDPYRIDVENKPYASIYVELDTKHVVRESGFDHMPYLVPRWSKAPEETYGRGPAMHALPGIKIANALSRTILEASELAIRPPIMVAANSIEGPIRTTPGSILYYRSGAREVPQPLVSGANPSVGEALLAKQEARIEEYFFLDNLKLPMNDRMTATEITARRQQGLMTASPVLSRLYSEWLNPLIEFTYGFMRRKGYLPEPPEVLKGRTVTIEYRSPMAASKKSAENQAFMQSLQTILPLMQANPGILDILNTDDLVRGVMFNNGVDPRFIKPENQVQQERQQKAQAQQQAMMTQQIQQQAAAARDASAAAKQLGEIGG